MHIAPHRPKTRSNQREHGFTLVELIAVLIILGLVAAAGSMGFTQAIQGYVFSTDNSAVAQQAQMALNRITIELTHLDYNPVAGHVDHDSTLAVGYEVTASSRTSITYNANYGESRGQATNQTIALVGQQLQINNQVLCDQVTAFSFDYFAAPNEASPSAAAAFNPLGTRMVGVNLTITGMNGVPLTFNIRVVPKFPKYIPG